MGYRVPTRISPCSLSSSLIWTWSRERVSVEFNDRFAVTGPTESPLSVSPPPKVAKG